MKTILKWFICVIIIVVLWQNFGKLIEIGNAMVNFCYNLIVN